MRYYGQQKSVTGDTGVKSLSFSVVIVLALGAINRLKPHVVKLYKHSKAPPHLEGRTVMVFLASSILNLNPDSSSIFSTTSTGLFRFTIPSTW
jgi:hypothetical protein